MIENMRKYTGLMVVVLVLLAAGLILTMGVSPDKSGGGETVTTVYGEDVSKKEYQLLSGDAFNALTKTVRLDLYGYLQGSSPLAQYTNILGIKDQVVNGEMSGPQSVLFVQRRIVIRKKLEELGLSVSNESALTYLRENLFITNGEFDSKKETGFMKELGTSGLTRDEFIELVGEALACEQLVNILTANFEESKQVAKTGTIFNLQTLNISTIKINAEDYKKTIKPTEEEIKSFWEENEGRYLTEKKYKLSYISDAPTFAEPKPAKPAEIPTPEAPKRPEPPTASLGLGSEADLAKKQELFKQQLAAWEKQMVAFQSVLANHQKKVNEQTDAWERNVAEWEKNVQSSAVKKIRKKFRPYYEKVLESSGSEFENAAKDAGYEVKKTDFITAKELPEEIKDLTIPVTSRTGLPEEKTLGEAIFAKKLGKEARTRVFLFDRKLSNDGIVFVRIDEVREPESKKYEDAKAAATEDLIVKKAYEAMIEDAKALKTSLTEAVKAGKTIEDAAKEKNQKATTISGLNVQNIRTLQTEDGPNLGFIFDRASLIKHNTFTEEDIEDADSSTLIFLNNRSVIQAEDFEARTEQAAQYYDNQLGIAVFRAWLKNALTEAELPDPGSN